MKGFTTPAEARETYPCPLARTFHEKASPNCMAGDCPVWRWKPLMADDPRFTSAIQREMACLAQDKEKEDGKKRAAVGFHKQAVANVMKDPEAYGVPAEPERGYCGLGGEPKS